MRIFKILVQVCFLCLKTRFSIFGPWGQICKLCNRTVCSKCYSKVNLSLLSQMDSQLRSVPYFSINLCVNFTDAYSHRTLFACTSCRVKPNSTLSCRTRLFGDQRAAVQIKWPGKTRQCGKRTN